MPQASPIAAAVQITAAEVRPRTLSPCRIIAPAPRKPIPETICAAIRVGSPPCGLPGNSAIVYEIIESNVDDMLIRTSVLIPTV